MIHFRERPKGFIAILLPTIFSMVGALLNRLKATPTTAISSNSLQQYERISATHLAILKVLTTLSTISLIQYSFGIGFICIIHDGSLTDSVFVHFL